MRTILIATLAWMAAAGAAGAAGSRDFNDWRVVCSNVGDCSAFGWGAEDTASSNVWLRIDRGPAGGAAPVVTLSMTTQTTAAPRIWRATVDGHPIAGLETAFTGALLPNHILRASFTPAQGAALIAAIRNGRRLRLYVGDMYGEVSLAGSAAALLYFDDQQHRVGTVTALQRPGTRPAPSAAPPVMPIVRLGGAAAQTGLPARVPAAVMTLVEGDCDDPHADLPPRIARLRAGLLLYGAICRFDPRSPEFRFFTTDEQGRGAVAITPPDARGLSDEGAGTVDTLENGAYDPATRILSSVGYADESFSCGTAYRWAWDGRAFQLLDVQVMDECHGVPRSEWPLFYVSRAAPARAE